MSMADTSAAPSATPRVQNFIKPGMHTQKRRARHLYYVLVLGLPEGVFRPDEFFRGDDRFNRLRTAAHIGAHHRDDRALPLTTYATAALATSKGPLQFVNAPTQPHPPIAKPLLTLPHQRCLAHSLDHLVGAGKKRWRHREAERLRGLEIDYQVVFGRRLHRQVARLLALEDAVNVTCRATVWLD